MLKKQKLLYAEITAKIWQAFRKLTREFEAHDGFLENQNAKRCAMNSWRAVSPSAQKCSWLSGITANL